MHDTCDFCNSKSAKGFPATTCQGRWYANLCALCEAKYREWSGSLDIRSKGFFSITLPMTK